MMGWIYDNVMEFRRRKYKLHTESKFMKACYTYCTVQCQPDKYDCQCQLTSNPTKSQKNLEIVIGETNFLDFDLDIGNIGDDLAIGVNAKFDFDKLGFPISSRDGLKCEDRRGSFESGVSIRIV